MLFMAEGNITLRGTQDLLTAELSLDYGRIPLLKNFLIARVCPLGAYYRKACLSPILKTLSAWLT